MKQASLFMVVLAAVLLACQSPKTGSDETAANDTSATAAAPVTLTMKWETEPLLTTCESVIYDKDRDVLYVSNINGQPDGKDGNGFISKVSLDGKVTEQEWVKGLDAPKGMGLAGGKLYVTDINRVHEIDVSSGKVTKTHTIEGAQFLNDITTDDSGKVYVSDMAAGKVHVIENGQLSTWLENVAGPNGLYAEGNQLVMATWNDKNLNTVDLGSKQVTTRTDGIENPDGIESIGNGEYLVSSWNGAIHHIGSDWKKTLVLDTRADSISSADIEYIQDRKLLLIPTFFRNTVRAYVVNR